MGELSQRWAWTTGASPTRTDMLRSFNSVLITGCLGLWLLCVSRVDAADRALLIGIGAYQLDNAALPGIGEDIKSMYAVARSMGIAAEHIAVLEDRQATLAGIRVAFQRYLIRGVGPGDRALFYFSGHGTQVLDDSGDETDGADEALMVHDTRQRYRGGDIILEQVLLDDELEELLSAVPADDLVVIVDACHSGTVTRVIGPQLNGAGTNIVGKAYVYRGMPEGSREGFLFRGDRFEVFNYVGISAAQDDQMAIATDNGSVFTNAIAETVRNALLGKVRLTPSKLASEAATIIELEVDAKYVFVPQLSGDLQRAETLVLVNGS